MNSSAELSGVPTPEMVRSAVTRGQPVMFPLAPGADVWQARTAAKTLQGELPEDFLVIVAQGPVGLNVLQLIDEDEARGLRGELDALVADYREMAAKLAAQVDSDPEPDEVDCDGQTWWLHVHGDHGRFESLADGTVVEALLERPDDIDPYFLLTFAETSGRHPQVLAACVHGFHDMARMLDLAEQS